MIRQFGKYWLPVILYASTIFYFSSKPEPLGKVVLFPHADIPMHILEFGFLGMLIRRAFINASLGYIKKYAVFLTLVLGIMYAVTDEIHQSYVPGREVSGIDLFSDSFGIFASLFVNFPRKKKL